MLKRKLTDLINQYDEYIYIDAKLDEIYQLLKHKKIRLNHTNGALLNNITVPLKINDKDTSYILTGKTIYGTIHDNITRCKIDYKDKFMVCKNKLENQIKYIDLINYNKIKHKLVQTKWYLGLVNYKNDFIISNIKSFLSQDIEYYKKLFDDIHINIVVYKNNCIKYNEKYDYDYIKNIINMFNTYLI